MTMHKDMDAIKNKNWAEMQAYFQWNKGTYQYALDIMENDNRYDFQKMFMEDPELFVFYVRILEDKNPKFDTNLFWDLHLQAYQHLKADGFFNTNVTQLKIEQVNNLVDKLNGPCLLSINDIEDCMTVKTKRKVTTTHFEFHDILHMIEDKYDFKSRGFFNNLRKNKKAIFHKYCPDSNYDKISNTSPVDNLAANYMSIISNCFSANIEEIDFWIYLMNYEFCEVSNGCMKTMWRPEYDEDDEEVNLLEIIDTKKEMQDYIGNIIKNIFFKEIAQVKDFKEKYDGIEFFISW